MNSPSQIDIKDDFYTFRNNVIDEFGDFYTEQTEIFFERAVYFAEKGFPLNAIADAKFAFALSNYQSDDYRTIYLIGFLCQIHLDNNFIEKAKSYCDLGFKILDKESSYYENDFKSFTELREIIKGEDWKTKL